MDPELCLFWADFNVPGNSKPWPMNLTAYVWALSHYVPTEKRVGQTVTYKWPQDGKYYKVTIIKKHDDGTYDVYFPNDDIEVERVDPSDFEPFKGTFSTCYFVKSP